MGVEVGVWVGAVIDGVSVGGMGDGVLVTLLLGVGIGLSGRSGEDKQDAIKSWVESSSTLRKTWRKRRT